MVKKILSIKTLTMFKKYCFIILICAESLHSWQRGQKIFSRQSLQSFSALALPVITGILGTIIYAHEEECRRYNAKHPNQYKKYWFEWKNPGCEKKGSCKEFEKFVGAFKLPEKYKTIIKDHEQSTSIKDSCVEILSEKGFIPCLFGKKIPEFPFYFKRQDFTRVINAYKMRRCIEENNLDLLGIAEEYIVKVNGEWTICSKEITDVQSISENSISLDIAKQLCTLAEITGYSDWHRGNWLMATDYRGKKKLICPDQADDAFQKQRDNCCQDFCVRAYGQCSSSSKLIFVKQLASPYQPMGPFKKPTALAAFMTPEAIAYLNERIEQLKNDFNATKNSPSLPYSNRYSHPTINFRQVLNEWKGFRTILESNHKPLDITPFVSALNNDQEEVD